MTLPHRGHLSPVGVVMLSLSGRTPGDPSLSLRLAEAAGHTLAVKMSHLHTAYVVRLALSLSAAYLCIDAPQNNVGISVRYTFF